LAKLIGQFSDINGLKEFTNSLGAHLGDEFAAEFFNRLAEPSLRQEFFVLKRGFARINDNVGLEVEHFLDFFERHVEQCTDASRQTLQKPDVNHRCRQLDMAHALATN